MDSRSFRVLLMSSFEPRQLVRLVERIHEEIPQAAVCGILYEPGRTKTLWQRIVNLVQNLTNPSYLPYVAARLLRTLALPAVVLCMSQRICTLRKRSRSPIVSSQTWESFTGRAS